uniref:Dolichol-phosphate mannosyltransferase subunit 3 n=1 Tax=Rhinolophus ferrumequinum TaxID=59479 RepID=A0A671G0I9_RHIFE
LRQFTLLCHIFPIFSFLDLEGTMTKLAQWLWALALLSSSWAVLIMGALGLQLSCREVLWPLPAYLLVSAGCYALGHCGLSHGHFSWLRGCSPRLVEPHTGGPNDLAGRGMCF